MEGPRGASKGDISGIVDLANTVFRSQERSMGEEFPLLYHESNAQNLRIILEEGKPISLVGIIEGKINIFGHALSVGCIGSVSTYEEYRGRGYAGMLLRDAMKKMFRDGIDYMLVSGGRGLYIRHGCAPAGVCYRYRIPRGKLESTGFAHSLALEDTLSLKEYPGDEPGCQFPDVGALSRIYHAEPLRYLRSKAQFEMLLGPRFGRKRMGGLEKLFVVFHAGLPVAYAILRISREKDGSNNAEIIEYAGDRILLFAHLARIAASCSLDVFIVTVSGTDVLMRSLLESLGVDGAPNTLPGHTFRVINFPGLMRRLLPYFEERAGREALNGLSFRSEPTGVPTNVAPDDEEFNRIFGVRHILEYQGERLAIEDEGILAKLIFGHPGEDVLGGLGMSEHLRMLLEEILPLPVPIPGLNYV